MFLNEENFANSAFMLSAAALISQGRCFIYDGIGKTDLRIFDVDTRKSPCYNQIKA